MLYNIKLSLSNCLLTYAFDTDPAPLQVSPERGNLRYGAITIVVSHTGDEAVYCKEIRFFLPIGDCTSALTMDHKAILASVHTNTEGQWNINNNEDGSFTATPEKPIYRKITKEHGLVFHINDIPVNKKVGTSTLEVQEETSNDNKNFEPRSCSQNLSKFPYGFFFKNLAPYREDVSGGLTPTAAIENGGKVTLAWSGASNATYTILYGGEPQDVTERIRWTSPALHDTTTFLLEASTQQHGEIVKAYLSTTVVVQNPEIKATSLDVKGKVQEQGHDLLPQGSIIMWSGKIDSIPQGWALCNGENGTPDLRNRFIVGGGNKYGYQDQGGQEIVTLSENQMPTHSHNLTIDEAGAHHHNLRISKHGWAFWDCAQNGDNRKGPRDLSTSTDGNHTHPWHMETSGESQPHENLPPYFALYFIMKL